MSISVFLADDHAVLLNGLEYMVAAQPDMEVAGAVGNGRDAVLAVEQDCPDVVVMDISMPELNGIEAAKQMLAHYPEARIVILSMHSSPEYIIRALQVGALGYVLKESVGSEVLAAVRAVYTGQRYLSRDISDSVLDYYLTHVDLVDEQNPLDRLTGREREILQLVVEGKTTETVANLLSISPNTVKSYRSRMMQKLGIDNLPTLVRFAIRQGLILLE